jgi:four helix bundle protein
MRDFKGLKVWQRAHHLTVQVYKETDAFPRREQFGLTNQIRRACVSIPANVAEGCGRRSQKDFARFLQVSVGSSNELEYYLILSKDLGYLAGETHSTLASNLADIRRMLSSLLRKVGKDTDPFVAS